VKNASDKLQCVLPFAKWKEKFIHIYFYVYKMIVSAIFFLGDGTGV
jgi:hypothetical protein